MQLKQSVGETSGDIPLFSLHRIKKLLRLQPVPEVSSQLITMLIGFLMQANQKYRRETQNRWNCLTAHNLDSALDNLNEALDEAATAVKAGLVLDGGAEVEAQVDAMLTEASNNTMLSVRTWFHDHFEELHYDMSGKIPWAVVVRLQANLKIWVAGVKSPFHEDIEDMVLNVAEKDGIVTDDPGDAWIKMGGKVLNK